MDRREKAARRGQILIAACCLALVLFAAAALFLPRETPLSAAGKRVDINAASEAELTMLPHIGPARAKAIVAYRTENGPFPDAASIMNVKGIGRKIYEEIEKYIAIG